jgi:hypothetical protein
MDILGFPDPASWVTEIKDDAEKRAILNAIMSATYSSWICFLWRWGQRNLLGLGPALRDAATSAYLTLHQLEANKFMTLTVPQDLMEPNNLAKFQTEEIKK